MVSSFLTILSLIYIMVSLSSIFFQFFLNSTFFFFKLSAICDSLGLGLKCCVFFPVY